MKSALVVAVIIVAVCQNFNILLKNFGPFRVEESKCSPSHQFPGEELNHEGLDRVQGECYFNQNFENATDLFVKSALLAGAELSSMPVTDSLYTKVAILHGDPRSYLIHISGVHGVEGPAGSAIQSAALQFLKNENERRQGFPTIVFIHAANPYGFANSRRVNEDNIDMNRNFLTEEEFAEFQRRDPNYSGYSDLDQIINPTSRPSTNYILNEMYSYILAVKSIIQHGFTSVKRAMVAGNYHKQTGFGFGGFERSRGTENLIDLVQNKLRIPESASKVVLIDVHTGLGPEGVDTVLMDHEIAHTVDAISAFPTEFDAKGIATGGLKEGKFSAEAKDGAHQRKREDGPVSLGYELTVGTVSSSFCKRFLAPQLNESSRICVTQEFGTVPSVFVGTTMINENYAFHHGSFEEKLLYSDQISKCFNPKRTTWQRSVVKRGLHLFLQAIDALDKLPLTAS